MLSCVYADSLQYTVIIYVNREERGRSAAHGDACRAAEALFASSVVEMGAWDVCEASFSARNVLIPDTGHLS